MQWFNFKKADQTFAFPPVRRKIDFPKVNENLKTNDWLYVPLGNLNVGRMYSYIENEVVISADPDSYCLIYQTPTDSVVTYSYIDSSNNLWFKSLTEVTAGNKPEGIYYIYYHYNNIQYIERSNSVYVASTTNSFIASENGSGSNVIDKYSNVVFGDSSNQRISSISYINVSGSWLNQKSNSYGNKIMGTFDGPRIKIYGDKSIDSGKIKVKIIKTSTNSTGQVVLKEEIVDLYSSNLLQNVEIFSYNAVVDPLLTEAEDFYGSFLFEIEILEQKNVSSSDRNVKITKYSFAKNYNLSLEKEEIYEGITFISTGVIR